MFPAYSSTLPDKMKIKFLNDGKESKVQFDNLHLLLRKKYKDKSSQKC